MSLGRVGEKKLGLWGRLKRVMLTDVGALFSCTKPVEQFVYGARVEQDFSPALRAQGLNPCATRQTGCFTARSLRPMALDGVS